MHQGHQLKDPHPKYDMGTFFREKKGTEQKKLMVFWEADALNLRMLLENITIWKYSISRRNSTIAPEAFVETRAMLSVSSKAVERPL